MWQRDSAIANAARLRARRADLIEVRFVERNGTVTADDCRRALRGFLRED